MAGKQAISEVVGRALFANQDDGVVYRALRPIRCASCDQVIGGGELFTRHAMLKQSMRILPKCRKCVPFNLRSEDEQTRHPMLDALLSPSACKPSGPQSAPAQGSSPADSLDHAKQERIRQAVKERLGPALARSRSPKA